MHITCYRISNYRRLRDVRVELASDISIFVGANNSGKTSATQAVQMFLSASKERFSLFDFSSPCWKTFNDLGATDAADDGNAVIPSISLDLWFNVTADELLPVIPILPSTEWDGTEVGIRIEFGAINAGTLMGNFREARRSADAAVASLGASAGGYIPWPSTMTEYLERELQAEFEFRYYALDRARFDADYFPEPGYTPPKLGSDTSGKTLLNGLIRVDGLNAQRHLDDPSAGGTGSRAEDLSKRLSRFYQRNLEQRAADHKALKALFESEIGLNEHFMDVFKETLDRLRKLGYPGMSNPQIEIKSAIKPASILSQDAKVNYVVGDVGHEVHLPDTHNGLGFKNLIYMVVEILDIHTKWLAEEDRPPLHLIFIEEPEAHLHAQLQQVFIRNVLTLIQHNAGGGVGSMSQLVVTTHSPHILYERGFSPIRYFRRYVAAGQQTTSVLNLSRFTPGDPKDRDFLQRYLKLTHCDLFFADAAILVEGNVERLLMPIMIEKVAEDLRSAALTILEVGGAYGHRFKDLIEFLGITTLIVTDIDSVVPLKSGVTPDEDEDVEFEPVGEQGGAAERRFGKKCLPGDAGALTSNQTLVQWLPGKRTIAELWAASAEDKEFEIPNSDRSKVRVTYQTPVEVDWNGVKSDVCGRTLEEAFGLDNASWCQHAERQIIGLKLRGPAPATAAQLAAGLNRRVTGKQFDKTKFALGVLACDAQDWTVPTYIKEGLVWLRDVISKQLAEEAVAGALANAAIEVDPALSVEVA